MKRDSQRSAVYAWERLVEGIAPQSALDKMSLAECEELVRLVWSEYRPGEDPPEVRDGRGRLNACGGRWVIKLPRWARSQIVTLHEIAHSLQPKRPAHGPSFAMLVLDLWARYAGIERTPAKRLGIYQKPRRVRFASPKDTPQIASRDLRRWRSRKEELEAEIRRLRKLLGDHIAAKPRR